MIYFAVIEEGGVKMKLTVVDTPGFGDQINNDNWLVVLQLLDHSSLMNVISAASLHQTHFHLSSYKIMF